MTLACNNMSQLHSSLVHFLYVSVHATTPIHQSVALHESNCLHGYIEPYPLINHYYLSHNLEFHE